MKKDLEIQTRIDTLQLEALDYQSEARVYLRKGEEVLCVHIKESYTRQRLIYLEQNGVVQTRISELKWVLGYNYPHENKR